MTDVSSNPQVVKADDPDAIDKMMEIMQCKCKYLQCSPNRVVGQIIARVHKFECPVHGLSPEDKSKPWSDPDSDPMQDLADNIEAIQTIPDNTTKENQHEEG